MVRPFPFVEIERRIAAENQPFRQLLTSEFWNKPLERFAKATGLTVSLYDSNAVRQAGPFGKSPIFNAIEETGYFRDGEAGSHYETAKVSESLSSSILQVHSFLGILGLCTAPVFAREQLVGVLAAGWVPNTFADDVSSARVAEAVGLSEMEIWQVIRMQQPMSCEKMTINVEMLQNFVEAILLQLAIKEEDSIKAGTLSVLNEAALKLSNAESFDEVATSVTEGARKLLPNADVRVVIFGEEKSGAESESHFHPDEDLDSIVSMYSTRFPMQSTSKSILGYIEIVSSGIAHNNAMFPELKSLSAQAAVAIQKTRLIHALYEERQAIDMANAELRALHRMKDEFLATISHELRTPLNSILGWSQILNDDRLPPDEILEASAAIERNARIQAKLIEDLLDVSRIISGKMEMERILMDVRSVLLRSLETVKPTAESRNQEFVLDLPEDSFMVRGDPTRLQQVFWNILSNSVKFTPDSGKLRISLKKAGGYAKIVISDNGKGINKDFLPHLFDRFSQADGSNTRRYGGLGLGLAIVRHIVELHGGSIEARSEGEGLGSTFHITLPINMTEDELNSARHTLRELDYGLEVGRSQLKGMKILAVDDEQDSLHLVTFILEKAGAQVKAVSSAQDALEGLKKWRPDLIVSDISMPGEDGYQLLQKVRELSLAEGGATPAFALTAHAGEDNQKEAIAAGFQRHFSKPIDPKTFLSSIREFSNYH